MEIPVEIDFQGMEQAPAIREKLAAHVAALETRFGRITACRVLLKGPGAHHHTGGLYEVHVQLVLPDGREVNVGRVNQGDERRRDIDFAINNAFKRARRQLQDRVRKLQGQTKHHEPPLVGTVARMDPKGDYGFIAAAGGGEIYFHRNSVLDGAYARLKPGSRVSYVEEPGEKGPQASTVRLLGKQHPEAR